MSTRADPGHRLVTLAVRTQGTNVTVAYASRLGFTVKPLAMTPATAKPPSRSTSRCSQGPPTMNPMLPPQLGRGVTLEGLHWRGRTFDVTIGPDDTTVTQRAGAPFAVESPQGTQMVSTGSPLSLKTRRPDLAPTDNLARCKPAQASSQELGMLAEGAVDGSVATIWAPAPTAPGGSLRVDLGKRSRISRITLRWTDALPSTFQILTSNDGASWTPAPPADPDGTLRHPVNARFVRVDLTRGAGEERVGIRELEVIG